MSTNPAPVSTESDGHVVTVVINRPPHNFVDVDSMKLLADTLEALDQQHECRAVVLAAEGKSFCAGADFSKVPGTGAMLDPAVFYVEAMRLFRTRKPIVAAVHGAAIGAGAGLALVADFRVACPASRFSVNFNRLGFHPGFGLSCTLPRLVGTQAAARLFYTGDRIDGAQMLALGIADELATDETVRARAQALARESAVSAPQAVQTTRATLRLGLADEVARANARELAIQQPQFASQDFVEGVRAAAERRLPRFTGH